MSREVDSKIVSPVQGNATAEDHNDAATLAATERYYTRTEEWPASWSELEDDIASVTSEMKACKPQSVNPFSFSRFSNHSALVEESQSIFSRAPDLSLLIPERLRALVDIDFSAEPEAQANENWPEFAGIIPHKPTYNTYRVEFDKLISQLNERESAAGPSDDAGN